MVAVIEAGGKQYLVKEGDKIFVNKIRQKDTGENNRVVFDKILLLSEDNKLEVGKPYIDGVKVEGKILRDLKRKTLVWRFKSKTRYRRKKGYKNYYNQIQIESIKR